MAYKNLEKFKATRKEWKKKNKNKIRAHQKKYTEKINASKYSKHINTLETTDDSGKILYLSMLKGSTIGAIIKRVPDDKHEKYMNLWEKLRGGKLKERKPTLSKEEKERRKGQRYKLKNKKYLDHIYILLPLSELDRLKYLVNLNNMVRYAVFKRLSNDQQTEFKKLFKEASTYNKKEKIRKNVAYMIQQKKDNSCEHCKEDNYLKLSFHHINENSKLRFPNKSGITMLDVARRYSFKVLEKEIKKCIILCHNCHHTLHYSDYKKNIFNNYKKLWNKKKTKQEWKYMYTIRNRALLLLYKEILNCIKCNEDRLPTLIFHHIDYTTKKNKISKLNTIISINTELQKCICLCRNCHEEYHQIYGKDLSNGQDMKKYLGFTPILLIADISDYKKQFYIELKQI